MPGVGRLAMHDDGLPDEAFTEIERSAGLPHIMRPDTSYKAPECREIESTISEEGFIDFLLETIRSGGATEMRVKGLCLDPNAEYTLDSLELVTGDPERVPNLGFMIESKGHREYVSFQVLSRALRNSGLPLLDDSTSPWWAAWDPKSLRLMTSSGFPCEWLWRDRQRRARERRFDEEDEPIVSLMRRFALTPDHGMKPVLIRKENWGDALKCREVDFVDPTPIAAAMAAEYVLAYFNSRGDVQSICLKDAVRLDLPVATRNCSYVLQTNELRPSLSQPKLLASAYSFASMVLRRPHEAKNFAYFLARERGSVFHPAIEPIEFDLRDERDLDPFSSLSSAICITRRAAEFGPVYLTAGGHPLDCEIVTTPELYACALRRLGDPSDAESTGNTQF